MNLPFILDRKDYLYQAVSGNVLYNNELLLAELLFVMVSANIYWINNLQFSIIHACPWLFLRQAVFRMLFI